MLTIITIATILTVSAIAREFYYDNDKIDSYVDGSCNSNHFECFTFQSCHVTLSNFACLIMQTASPGPTVSVPTLSMEIR